MRSLLLLPILATGLAAQTFVEGHVIDAVTGAPVSGAYVGGGNWAGSDPLPITDAAGHFRLPIKDKWVYVAVKHNNYLAHYDTFQMEPGQSLSDLRVLVVPQAVISGRVFDENGVPVRGAFVTAMQFREVDGQRRLQRWRGIVATNDLGEYRISGLPAGRYYLAVTPEKMAEWDPRYGVRLYPDAQDAAHAEAIEIRIGEERSGRDIRLTRLEGVTITGHIVSAVGKNRFSLWLTSAEYDDYKIPVTIAGDSFTISHVPPGNYNLRTWTTTLRPRIGDPIADLALQVGRADIHDVNVEVQPIAPQDISGCVVFSGSTQPAPMTISLRRELGDVATVTTNPDRSFTFKGVLPGRYWLEGITPLKQEGTAPVDRRVISAQLGTREVWGPTSFDINNTSPGAFKITMSSPVGKVTGKLLDANGRPVAGGQIMFLSADHIPSGTGTREDGSFTASIVAAGEQHVYILARREESDAFRDPDYLELHRDDYAPIRFTEGDNPPLTLHLTAQ
jgi:Carboxypeptidase regulatory-like domain